MMNFAENILCGILKHWKVLSGILLASLTLAAFAFCGVFKNEPKPKSDSPKDLRTFASSGQFSKLPLSKQADYLAKLRVSEQGKTREERHLETESMSGTQKKQLFENMRKTKEIQRRKEMTKYFKLSKEERRAWLDAEIAKMEKRRAEMEAYRKTESTSQKTGMKRERPDPAKFASMMKKRIETGTPESRAIRQRYMSELLARMKETGKTMPRRGNGGPPQPM